MNSRVFELKNLRVTYGFRCAVEDLSLSLMPGQSLGLLGVNGAGKTSTIGAILGMIRPKQGQVRLFDAKPGNPRLFQRVGFAPEEALPPDYLSAWEYLKFVGALRVRKPRDLDRQVGEIIEWFELEPRKRIRQYSKGMKRRLILAQAFLGNPDLLVLDEPLNGLDPLIIIKLRERLESYRASGGSILYSSHILNEVEKTCSDVAILRTGKLVLSDGVTALKSKYGSIEEAFADKMRTSDDNKKGGA